MELHFVSTHLGRVRYKCVDKLFMMTSSNGNIFRVTGSLCGEFTGPGEFPTQRPVTRSFDVFFDLRLNKRLSKQPWGWWFEKLSWSLWRQCNECVGKPVFQIVTCSLFSVKPLPEPILSYTIRIKFQRNLNKDTRILYKKWMWNEDNFVSALKFCICGSQSIQNDNQIFCQYNEHSTRRCVTLLRLCDVFYDVHIQCRQWYWNPVSQNDHLSHES